MEWVPLVPIDALAPGGVVGADVGMLELVVWRTEGGRIVVMDGRCPHQWSYLGVASEVVGEQLVCTAHFWRFDPDGVGTKCNLFGRSDPKSDVSVYPSRERQGTIEALL